MPELKQRSHEWRVKRLGMVTASRFKDVVTQPRTKKDREAGLMSKTAQTYLHDLLTEQLIGMPLDRFSSKATDWGTQWEAEAFEEAKEAIGNRFGIEPELPENEYAFMMSEEEEQIGCSPDGILGTDGLLELKCPYNPRNHLETVLAGGMPPDHQDQVQGSLWVTGRQWYAFASYDPRFKGSAVDPLCVYRIVRDNEHIASLAASVTAFRDALMWSHKKIVAEYERKTEAPF